MASRAQLLFEDIKADPLTKIKKMVDEHWPETEYLDFKNYGAEADNKKNWAKALSGFANTEGGLVIWGVDARKTDLGDGLILDVAKSLEPFSKPAMFAELLKSIHREATVDPVSGVEYLPLPLEGESGFVVCYIPEGKNKPYRDEKAKQYYHRVQDSFAIMSHSLLKSIFNPVAHASLQISATWQNEKSVRLELVNNGPYSARQILISIYQHPNAIWTHTGISYRRDFDLHPMIPLSLCNVQCELDYRRASFEVHLICYMLDQVPQCFNVSYQAAPIDQRTGSNGIVIKSIEFSELRVFETDPSKR